MAELDRGISETQVGHAGEVAAVPGLLGAAVIARSTVSMQRG